MTTTYDLVDSLKSYLSSEIAAELPTFGVASDAVNLWSVGFRDPNRLEAYDAVLLVPDVSRPNDEEATVVVPIDVIVAVQASGLEAAYRKQYGIFDAIQKVVRDDSTLGGRVLESTITESDYYDPVSGSGLRVFARAVLEIEIDTLVE